MDWWMVFGEFGGWCLVVGSWWLVIDGLVDGTWWMVFGGW